MLVNKLFDTTLLDDVREDISGLVDQVAEKLYNAGKVKCML